MGRPKINMTMHMMKQNLNLLGLKYSGQLSTMPVINDSTPQNCESMPRVNNIRKKSKAQRGDGNS